ncbi:lysine amidinotransferase [Cordyceps fumosorosea ARSEF 2679]|uniref:Glycine amidinotransferase, mitochondrial n=1 Tax=Cordyceps fumosorosea (strain ARSEF 2679) TaxID=1081104 RepID=A0A168DCL1_CORFA|nr:lysine amidinotransferase [Cordyceps fumosorosea ARSEF 2679]OAA72440.1 lysine amidinotransferase [Cordyceps fumosorosea ARSEF 2679]
MTVKTTVLISADDEWSPLKSVIVGRAEHSAFPAEPPHLVTAVMPPGHWEEFKPNNAFPKNIVENAQKELDNFASVLEQHGVHVYRPTEVDWVAAGGYTGSMSRDALMTVGSTLIESAFAFGCRRHEVDLGYSEILAQLSAGTSPATIVRAPRLIGRDTIYDGVAESISADAARGSVISINNSRVAFDTADFMRFGKTIIGQLSHVTNERGVAYVRSVLPDGYTLEMLDTGMRPGNMHIDTTILPLRKGLMIYSPKYVNEESIRRHAIFKDWELHAYPFEPEYVPGGPPPYTCSPWLVLNGLSLDEKRIFVEEKNVEFAEWVRDKFGMEPIMLPFQHVNCLGGSFHCATVDLVRES